MSSAKNAGNNALLPLPARWRRQIIRPSRQRKTVPSLSLPRKFSKFVFFGRFSCFFPAPAARHGIEHDLASHRYMEGGEKVTWLIFDSIRGIDPMLESHLPSYRRLFFILPGRWSSILDIRPAICYYFTKLKIMANLILKEIDE